MGAKNIHGNVRKKLQGLKQQKKKEVRSPAPGTLNPGAGARSHVAGAPSPDAISRIFPCPQDPNEMKRVAAKEAAMQAAMAAPPARITGESPSCCCLPSHSAHTQRPSAPPLPVPPPLSHASPPPRLQFADSLTEDAIAKYRKTKTDGGMEVEGATDEAAPGLDATETYKLGLYNNKKKNLKSINKKKRESKMVKMTKVRWPAGMAARPPGAMGVRGVGSGGSAGMHWFSPCAAGQEGKEARSDERAPVGGTGAGRTQGRGRPGLGASPGSDAGCVKGVCVRAACPPRLAACLNDPPPPTPFLIPFTRP